MSSVYQVTYVVTFLTKNKPESFEDTMERYNSNDDTVIGFVAVKQELCLSAEEAARKVAEFGYSPEDIGLDEVEG